MKFKRFAIICLVLMFGALTSAIIFQPKITSATLSEDKSTLHFSVDLNKTGTDELNTKYTNKTSEKFGENFKDFNPNNAKSELTLRFAPKEKDLSERRAEVTGSIFIDSRSFGFKGKGIFEPFVTPDTNETLYLGDIEGELLGVNMSKEEPNYKEYDGNNSHWFVVFNPDTKEIHIAAGVGFQENTGIILFGDNMMNKERWDAYHSQLDERYMNK